MTIRTREEKSIILKTCHATVPSPAPPQVATSSRCCSRLSLSLSLPSTPRLHQTALVLLGSRILLRSYSFFLRASFHYADQNLPAGRDCHGSKFDRPGLLLSFIFNNRATVQIIVSIVSAILAGLNVDAMSKLLNLATRIRLLRQSLSLDLIKVIGAVTTRRLEVGLSALMSAISVIMVLLFVIPNLLWTGALTPMPTPPSWRGLIRDRNTRIYLFFFPAGMDRETNHTPISTQTRLKFIINPCSKSSRRIPPLLPKIPPTLYTPQFITWYSVLIHKSNRIGS